MKSAIENTYVILDEITTSPLELFWNPDSGFVLLKSHVGEASRLLRLANNLDIPTFVAELENKAVSHNNPSSFINYHIERLFGYTLFQMGSIQAFIESLKNRKFEKGIKEKHLEIMTENLLKAASIVANFIEISVENLKDISKRISKHDRISKENINKKKSPIRTKKNPRPTLEEMLGKEKLDEIVSKLLDHDIVTRNNDGSIIFHGNPMDRDGNKGQLAALSHVLLSAYNKNYSSIAKHHAFTLYFNTEVNKTYFKDSYQGQLAKYLKMYYFLKYYKF